MFPAGLGARAASVLRGLLTPGRASDGKAPQGSAVFLLSAPHPHPGPHKVLFTHRGVTELEAGVPGSKACPLHSPLSPRAAPSSPRPRKDSWLHDVHIAPL